MTQNLDFDTCKQLLAIDNEDVRALAMKTVRHHAQALLPIAGLFLVRAVEDAQNPDFREDPARILTIPSGYRDRPDLDLYLGGLHDGIEYAHVVGHLLEGELDEARKKLRGMDTFPREYCPDDTYAWLTT